MPKRHHLFDVNIINPSLAMDHLTLSRIVKQNSKELDTRKVITNVCARVSSTLRRKVNKRK